LTSDCVIDACCLINLCAVGDLQRWLSSLGFAWHLPSAVVQETLYLRSADEEGNPTAESIDVERLLEAGLIGECIVQSGDEMRYYVELAADLDDGEAMALAIARVRGWILATDDRKARRRAAEAHVPVITTPELMNRSAERNALSADQIRSALQRIQRHARFVPAADFPEYEWWMSHLSRQE
jgi:predicted nucleic acid-binding protein